ncbi:hypothetical protein D3C86_1748950 [compost metagenome]
MLVAVMPLFASPTSAPRTVLISVAMSATVSVVPVKVTSTALRTSLETLIVSVFVSIAAIAPVPRLLPAARVGVAAFQLAEPTLNQKLIASGSFANSTPPARSF